MSIKSINHFFSFNYLKSYMTKKIEKIKYSGKKIPASSGGSGVELKGKDYQKFSDNNLQILAANECAELEAQKLSQAEKIREINASIITYFGGKVRADWKTFYYSFNCPTTLRSKLAPGIVERDQVQNQVSVIESTEDKIIEDEDEMVAIFGINHQPGSGATTVGMNVLWKMKHKMRCAVVDGSQFADQASKQLSLKRLASQIMFLRRYEENEDTVKCIGGAKPPTVLIMLDQSDHETATELKKSLLFFFQKDQIKSNRTQIMVMYLHSTYGGPEQKPGRINSTPVLEVTHHLHDEEDVQFKERLKYFDANEVPPETVFGFVILANKSDENSEYLRKVLKKAIDGIDLYPKVKDLLIACSLLTVHRPPRATDVFCFGLPKHMCAKYIDPSEAQINFFKMIPSQARIFFTERINREKSPRASYITIRHTLTAKLLLEYLCPIDEMVENLLILTNLLKHHADADFHKMMRIFLIRRSERAKGENLPENFSSVVSRLVLLDENAAIAVLESAFDAIIHENKMYIAQVLSKVYRHRKNMEEAKLWAKKAIGADADEPKYYLFDTLGQAFKAELR